MTNKFDGTTEEERAAGDRDPPLRSQEHLLKAKEWLVPGKSRQAYAIAPGMLKQRIPGDSGINKLSMR